MMILKYPEREGIAVDATVPTPRGYRRFGDLRVGDQVCDGNGDACTIMEIDDSLGLCTAKEVIFDDLTSLITGSETRWRVMNVGDIVGFDLASGHKLGPGSGIVKAVRPAKAHRLRSIRTDAFDPWFLAGHRASAAASIVEGATP